MEAVIFMGLPGSGKSTFYKERFFRTHAHLSLDVLRTRYRETRFLQICLDTQMRFVIDNTNPTRADRGKYLTPAKSAGFRVVGYYFRSCVDECLRRNARRAASVPEVAIKATAKKLEIPSLGEGFDALSYVRPSSCGFIVEDWSDEV